MVAAIAPLVTGLIAGLGEGEIIRSVLFNVALDAWSKKRRKKPKPLEQQNPSTMSDTENALGQPIKVLFGMANLGGNVFDVLNKEDGGYPVFGGTGYVFPRAFTSGVDLVDRDSIDYTDQKLVSYSKITRDADSGTAIEDQDALRKSVKFGNDAEKQINNAHLKFFCQGGYSLHSDYTDVIIMDPDSSIEYLQDYFTQNPNSGAHYTGSGSGDYFYVDWSLSADGGPGGFRNFTCPNVTVLDLRDLPSLPSPMIQARDIIRLTKTGSSPILIEVLDIFPAKLMVFTGEYSTNFHSYMKPIYTLGSIVAGVYMLRTSTSLKYYIDNGYKAEVIRFNGEGSRKADTYLQYQYGTDGLQQNNPFAWLAQEIRDPGSSTRNVTSGIVSSTLLLVDESVKNFNSLQIPEKSNYTLLQLVADNTEAITNPIAIIYEILTDNTYGLGWSVDKLDIDSFIDCYDRARATDSDIGGPAWKFGGYVMTTKQEARAYIEDILAHIHGDYAWTPEGKFKLFLWDGSVPASPKKLNMRNILRKKPTDSSKAGELQFRIGTRDSDELFNELNIRYIRPDKEFVADYYLRITDYADVHFSGAVKPKNMDMLGFFEERYAQKSGQIHVARNQKELEYYEASVDIHALDIEIGEIVLIQAFDSDSDNADAIIRYLAVNRLDTVSGDHVLKFDMSHNILEQPNLRAQDLGGGSTDITSVEFTGHNAAVLNTADNPETLGATTDAIFTVYDTDTSEFRKYIIKDTSSSSITVYLRPLEATPGNSLKGDKIVWNSQTKVIEDAGYDEDDGTYYIRVNGTFTVSPLNERVQLKKLTGIKMLNADRYAKVVDICGTRDLQTKITLQQYVPEAYSRDTLASLQTASPTYSIQNLQMKIPPAPAITDFRVLIKEDHIGNPVYLAEIQVAQISDPRVDRTVVSVFADGSNFGDGIWEEGTKTTKGSSIIQFPLTRVSGYRNPSLKVKFWAEAVSYNEYNQASEVSSSYVVLGDFTEVDDPVVEAPTPSLLPAPDSFYNKTLRILSKKYNNAMSAGLELRSENSGWGVTEADVTDSTLLARDPIQIRYEQKDGLPDTRNFTVYLKAYTKNGVYSTNADSLTLTDYAPAPILDSRLSTEEAGSTVKLTISGFDDGEGNIGSLFPVDIIKYELWECDTADGTYSKVAENTSPEFFSTVSQSDFSGADTLTKYYKVVAFDRLTDDTERDNSLSAVSGKEATFSKLQAADLQLNALMNELSDNLFRLDDWGYTGLSLEAEMNLVNGDVYEQIRGLEADTYYTVAWDVLSGSPTLVVSGDISPATTLTSSTTEAVFKTGIGDDKDITFTIAATGDASIRHIRLCEGRLAKRYTLHPNDRPIQEKTQRVINYVTSQMLETLDNMNVLLDDVDQLKTDIIQKSDEIRLRVVGNDILTQIILNEQGIYFGGRDLVFDGNAVFLNTSGVVWGKIIEVNGTTIKFNTGPGQEPTDPDTFYQTFSGTQGEPSTSFTVESLSRNPDTGVFTATVTSGDTPQLGLFIDASLTTTTIDGGKITTESIVANKIAAGVIGANKLIAEEIQTNFLQFVGKDNLILSDEGIQIFNNSAVVSNTATRVAADNLTQLDLTAGHGVSVDDFIRFDNGNNANVVRKITAVSTNRITFDAVAVGFDNNIVNTSLYRKNTTAYMVINIDSGKPTIYMANDGSTTKISTDGITLGSGTSLDVGSGNSSLHFDTTGNLWLGHADYASAPFKVSKDGEMTAESGVFKGSLNIGSGSFVVDTSGNVTAATLSLTQVEKMVDRISACGVKAEEIYNDSGTDLSTSVWTYSFGIDMTMGLPALVSFLETLDTITNPVWEDTKTGSPLTSDTFTIPEGKTFGNGSILKGYKGGYNSRPFLVRYKGSVSITGGVGGTVVSFVSGTPGTNEVEKADNDTGSGYSLNTTYWEDPLDEYIKEMTIALSLWADGSDYAQTTKKELKCRAKVKIWQKRLDSDGFNAEIYSFYTDESTLKWEFTPGYYRSWWNQTIYLINDGKVSDLNNIPFDEPFTVTIELFVKAVDSGLRYSYGEISAGVSLDFLTDTNKI